MKLVYQILSLAPAPLFFVGFVYNIIQPVSICGAWPYEMTVMWLVMALAHMTPWVIWLQQRNFTRN
jgi:hypothetical protein